MLCYKKKLSRKIHQLSRLHVKKLWPFISASQEKTCPSNCMYNKRLNLCWRHDKNHKSDWFQSEKKNAKGKWGTL